ncbi:Death-associated protein kinase 3 (DAP kinase 3) (DAP-like kinase) (Dlk) (MYPT1 kinase) (Zipper-interacting protein kinase) (ZIP-kinase) [Durusdinium trenchii]|uniref:Death-associated protein kinase 3 (DAP kinase 3) (DAP-like kinase) (Dlk) (MYPT1 kinase) (Zipper-interacting protein kinase) (ZIP-kinase) n=1 Tax=Durusdinium trenchii TaxID=1381693 RepID=A0ABP0IGU0_9DINO
MQLPAALNGPEEFVCYSCAKTFDGYPLEGEDFPGLAPCAAFRCFCCDKQIHDGVRYQLAGQDSSTSCWSPQESQETLCQHLLESLLELPKAKSTGSNESRGSSEVSESRGVSTRQGTWEMAEEPEESWELLRSLGPWLELLQLGHYWDQAKQWCQEMGAAEMEEVKENWELFADDLGLNEEERESLAEACLPQEMSPLLPAAKSRETFGDEAMPYVLQEKLGEGATAKVYKCKKGDEEYAVKVIDLHRLCLNPGYEKIKHTIMREMRLLLMLQHRNIVKLVDFQEQQHTIFLVMELIRGGDLWEYLLGKPNGHLDDKEACHLFLQIVDGLSHIHSKNIVHRDLKPQNILLAAPATFEEATGRQKSLPTPVEVKLSDFGHSKLVRDGYTYGRSYVGTPQYLSPEVANQKRYDERADLWSLGVVLYVMLTGSYPFRTSEDPAYFQGRFSFRGNRYAEELIHGLIKKSPHDRMSLEQCLQSTWVQLNGSDLTRGPSARSLTTTSTANDLVGTKECRIRLPRKPKNVAAFKTELETFSLKHRLSANLENLDVLVSFSCDMPEEMIEATKSELWEILHRNCPGLKRSNLFPEGPTSPENRASSNPILHQEHEALASIYTTDFEAWNDYEWVVKVGSDTHLRVQLPAGYPHSEPPIVSVECPRGTAPKVQRELENCWSAGSEGCVFQMVEILRAAVDAMPKLDTESGAAVESPGEEPPVKPEVKVSCDVQICHGETLADRKSTFQAHVALRVHTSTEVEWARNKLLSDKRIKGATHNVVAWRFRQRRPNKLVEDYDDDGEKEAGKKLLDLLQLRHEMDVMVMVSRWRGVVHLGFDRFRDYNKAAQHLLENMPEAGACAWRE